MRARAIVPAIIFAAILAVAWALGVPYEPNLTIAMAAAPAAASTDDVLAMVHKLSELTASFKARAEQMDRRERDTDAALAELKARFTGVEQELVRRGGAGPAAAAEFDSLGAQVMRHPNIEALKALAGVRGKITLNVRAALTTLPGGGGADMVPPDRRTEIVGIPRRRLIVRDLLPVVPTTSNLIEFPRQTIRELNADVVSEGTVKPESRIEFEMADAPVRTIAHFLKASRQILADMPRLRNFIDTELRYGLALAEETEILFGDGSGQHIDGIIPQATAFNPNLIEAEFHNRFDDLIGAAAQCQQALLPATGIVVNDIMLLKMRTIKDQNGQYLMPGGVFSTATPTLMGMGIVGTPALGDNDFLVGAFAAGATLYDREEANVMVATENEDDFIRNLLVALCEERVALEVRRPQAFVFGQFQAGSGT